MKKLAYLFLHFKIIKNCAKKEKILITGSSGFVGTNLINELKSKNFEIAVIDHNDNQNFKTITKYIGDICNYNFLENVILEFQPNKVFHLAGIRRDLLILKVCPLL